MEEKKDTSVVDAMVRVNLTNQTANNNLGITQGYNKENRDKLWDSKKGKADFNKTTIPYSYSVAFVGIRDRSGCFFDWRVLWHTVNQ